MHPLSHRLDVREGDRVELERQAERVADGLEGAVVRRGTDPATDGDTRDLGIVHRPPDRADDRSRLVGHNLDVSHRTSRGEREARQKARVGVLRVPAEDLVANRHDGGQANGARHRFSIGVDAWDDRPGTIWRPWGGADDSRPGTYSLS